MIARARAAKEGRTVRPYRTDADEQVENHREKDAVAKRKKRAAMSGKGNPVTQGADDLLDRSIESSGPGIANAKITKAPVTEDGRRIIELDATLD